MLLCPICHALCAAQTAKTWQAKLFGWAEVAVPLLEAAAEATAALEDSNLEDVLGFAEAAGMSPAILQLKESAPTEYTATCASWESHWDFGSASGGVFVWEAAWRDAFE
jgi:hypothetical protein